MDNQEAYVLRKRLREIDEEILNLQKERSEIKSAMDVVSRYLSPTTTSTATLEDHNDSDTGLAPTGTPRPDGIPTLWEMAVEVIEARGVASAQEVVDFIRDKYWPGVAHSQVGPSLYRFVKEQRLVKVGRGEFSMPTNEGELRANAASSSVTAISDENSEKVGGHPSLLPHENPTSAEAGEAKPESADGTSGFHKPQPWHSRQ